MKLCNTTHSNKLVWEKCQRPKVKGNEQKEKPGHCHPPALGCWGPFPDPTHFSPAIFRTSLASVPWTSSSHPPETLGRDLCFWIFFSSLISSVRNCAKALSPGGKENGVREREGYGEGE